MLIRLTVKEKKRIPTSGEPIAWKSPFAMLKNMEQSPLSESPVAKQLTLHHPRERRTVGE